MRKAMLFALMMSLLLTACGGKEKDPTPILQQQYAAVEAATIEAEILCHLDDEVRNYKLLCAYTPACSTVTVMEPEDLAGISATVEDGELTLNYGDISMDAGTYSEAAVSPVAVLPKLMEAAGWGYVTEKSKESFADRTCLRVSCDLQDDTGTVYTTWFDEESLLPLSSEVVCGGSVVYEVTWLRFEVTEQRGTEETLSAETGT